ncbi:MAG: tRNA (adenosine(37)-N6)-threonylcarbamoyltransferase complex dimerization subunit type 1 TsaB [Rhodospirillaceae bacterium]|nr:tRNA (adenosine(37)-N6)-threonylcarbamoyltransferase complex dimerization subunit type 1 TsaB [Rhodospirillaceae bacterium]
MNILAVDSATKACSAAVWQGDRIGARCFVPTVRGHAEMLIPMVGGVMMEAGLRFSDLDRLAVTIGPGHFTGLRAGLAAIRGVALASGLPVIGMTTLLAVAHGVALETRLGRRIVAALESKRAELYVQVFDERLVPLSAPLALTPMAAAANLRGPVLLVGDGAIRLMAALADGQAEFADAGAWPDAGVVARAAAALPEPTAGDHPTPLYLHPVEAQIPASDGGR